MGKSKKSEKKSKKKHKKHDKEKHKKSKKSDKKLKVAIKEQLNKEKAEKSVEIPKNATPEEDQQDFAIPLDLMNNKSHAPETAAEYQKRQNYIRRVTDPETGRVRLIKGDGEVLEEIVTKTRHQEINKSATQSDGAFFAEKTVGLHKRNARK